MGSWRDRRAPRGIGRASQSSVVLKDCVTEMRMRSQWNPMVGCFTVDGWGGEMVLEVRCWSSSFFVRKLGDGYSVLAFFWSEGNLWNYMMVMFFCKWHEDYKEQNYQVLIITSDSHHLGLWPQLASAPTFTSNLHPSVTTSLKICLDVF